MRRRSPCLPSLRPAAGRGYTAVEVMMAMTVMTIGAAAVMSMQKAAVQGNLDARQTDIANSLARMWVERLQKDAMQWTQPSSANPTLNNFAQAKLLSSQKFGQWGLPKWEMGQTTPESMSYAFDMLARDLPAANIATDTVFCVNYRLQWLVPQVLTGVTPEPGLIRADVRVLWQRRISNQLVQDWCNDATAQTDNPDSTSPNPPAPVFHSIYMTTTIRQGGQ